jgi:hypothetical protein
MYEFAHREHRPVEQKRRSVKILMIGQPEE